MIRFSGPIPQVTMITEEELEPKKLAEFQEVMRQCKRNRDWLSAHWKELLPNAAGRFIAIAGQEAFVADTHQEAWSRAKAAHPDDRGALSQFVPSGKGPRIYAHRR